MRAVVQRVTHASVTVDENIVGEIGSGLLVLVGVEKEDTLSDVKYIAGKVIGLRIFPDDADKMNLNAVDVSAEIMVVSQFTLLGDVRKGRRPSFIDAAAAEPNASRLESVASQHLPYSLDCVLRRLPFLFQFNSRRSPNRLDVARHEPAVRRLPLQRWLYPVRERVWQLPSANKSGTIRCFRSWFPSEAAGACEKEHHGRYAKLLVV